MKRTATARRTPPPPPTLTEADSPRGYYCGGCWRRFPAAELRIVTERIGCGFRCAECFSDLVEANR